MESEEKTVRINPILQTTIKTTAAFGDKMQIGELPVNSSSSLDVPEICVSNDDGSQGNPNSVVVTEEQQP